MHEDFIKELQLHLPKSDARLRKLWAEQIVSQKIPLLSLISLLHGPNKTAQRFNWLIGDLLHQDRTVVRPALQILFDLRDEMPFPGMRRTVARCLWYLGVPANLEKQAIPVLFHWLEDNSFAIGVKHYASKALFDLAIQDRVDARQLNERLNRVLNRQARHVNKAHASRMNKLRRKLIDSDARSKQPAGERQS